MPNPVAPFLMSQCSLIYFYNETQYKVQFVYKDGKTEQREYGEDKN